jgi:hypothetical protein
MQSSVQVNKRRVALADTGTSESYRVAGVGAWAILNVCAQR